MGSRKERPASHDIFRPKLLLTVATAAIVISIPTLDHASAFELGAVRLGKVSTPLMARPGGRTILSNSHNTGLGNLG